MGRKAWESGYWMVLYVLCANVFIYNTNSYDLELYTIVYEAPFAAWLGSRLL